MQPRHSRDAVSLGAVDDHPVLLTGLRREMELLDPRVEFNAHAPTVADLLVLDVHFDVVLLDLRLMDGSRPGNNVQHILATGARVLVYTEGGSRPSIHSALAAGASGVVRKDRPATVLVEAIRAVAETGVFASEELAQALDGVASLAPKLSDRELQVLRLYASGLPAKLVARRLDVGIETAREYLKRIRAKYAALHRPAYTRMELYQRAVEDGVMDPLIDDSRGPTL